MNVAEPLPAEELERIARHARWLVLSTVARAGAGHIGGPLSQMDLLVSLYFNHLRVDPSQPDAAERDRFILSKGHAAIGLYVVLALRGFFAETELSTFDQGESRLQGHPDMKLLPGIDTSSGSLGQGLSVGVGMALGARGTGKTTRTWVLLGDGELEEGMTWEAIYAARRHRLGNLIAVLDQNGLQQYGWPADSPHDRGDRSDPWSGVDLPGAFRAFGWRVLEVDGHDLDQIDLTFKKAVEGASDRPTVIIASTVKGKGISFTEGTYRWHNGIATQQQLDLAAHELGERRGEVPA